MSADPFTLTTYTTRYVPDVDVHDGEIDVEPDRDEHEITGDVWMDEIESPVDQAVALIEGMAPGMIEGSCHPFYPVRGREWFSAYSEVPVDYYSGEHEDVTFHFGDRWTRGQIENVARRLGVR